MSNSEGQSIENSRVNADPESDQLDEWNSEESVDINAAMSNAEGHAFSERRAEMMKGENYSSALSPVSVIATIMEGAVLTTPVGQRGRVEETAEDEPLISNSFSLNSGGRSPTSRRNEQRTRGAQRRLNMTPQKINYDEDNYDEAAEKDSTAEELSFYNGNSPPPSTSPCSYSPYSELAMSPETSPRRYNRAEQSLDILPSTLMTQRSFETDHSSVDSGYSINFSQDAQPLNTLPVSAEGSSKSAFQFVQPCGLPPRRADTSPPAKSSGVHANKSPASGSGRKVFHTLSSGSMDSMDDDYTELFDMASMDDDAQLPSGLNSLISGDIMSTTPEPRRPFMQRSVSLSEHNIQKARTSLAFKDINRLDVMATTPESLKLAGSSTTPNSTRMIDGVRCYKRVEPPFMSPMRSKRYKTESSENKENALDHRVLRKSMSMNDAAINMSNYDMTDASLTSDFSKKLLLPKTVGRHCDLNSISCETMSKLLNGAYDKEVASYKIIDCRYPYEFEGGHIAGALNLYTPELIKEFLMTKETESADNEKRNILIFHCEFSSERGPKLSRLLRQEDRKTTNYPSLKYPEVYLLDGGYKKFFESHLELCEPHTYRPMLHPSYNGEYKQFRHKPKSWNGVDQKTPLGANSISPTNRNIKSRSLNL